MLFCPWPSHTVAMTPRRNFTIMVLAVGAFALTMLAALGALSNAGNRIAREHVPQLMVVADFKFHLARFHEDLNKHLAREPSVGLDKVLVSFTDAERMIRVLIKGGVFKGQDVAPIEDKELLLLAMDLRDDLGIIQQTFLDRLTAVVPQEIANQEEDLEQLFEHLIEDAALFNEVVLRFMADQQRSFQFLSYSLVTGLLVAAIGVAFVLFHSERRRRAYLEGLQAAQMTLEHRVDERTREAAERSDFIGAIVGSMIDGVISIDDKGLIGFINKAAADIFGYEEKELLGANVNFLMGSPDHESHNGYLRRFIDTGEARLIGSAQEMQAVRRDGTPFPISLAVNEISVGGRQHFVSVVRDVTHFKEVEFQQQMAREAAERAERVKSQFLANISHELRTPMNAIIGMAHLAMKTKLDTQQHDYISAVHTSARRLLMLINDLLDFSKVDTDNLELHVLPFNVIDMIDGSLRVSRPKAEKRDVQVRTFMAEDVPPIVEGDPFRIGQILDHLLDNAIKFTGRGEVLVGVEFDHDEKTHGGLLSLTVADTGLGISASAKVGLFDPFTQGDGTTTRQQGGTGLGLAVCQRLATLMGGSIEVSSEPKQGSIFRVTLPVTVRAASVPQLGGEATSGALPERLPGVDVSLGLRRMNANVALYKQVAEDFLSRFADAPDVLRRGLASGVDEDLVRLIHSAKSLLGSLGALNAQASGLALESAMRNGDSEVWTDLLDDFETQSAVVVSGLASFIAGEDGGEGGMAEAPTAPAPAHPDENVAPADAEKAAASVRELAALLRHGDTQAETVASAVVAALQGASAAELAERVRDKAVAYDFDEALADVIQLAETLKIDLDVEEA